MWSWVHKICGALGSYNLWGLGFIKFMGSLFHSWVHKIDGALGSYNLWVLCGALGSWVHKMYGALGLCNLWGLGFIKCIGP